MYAEAGLLFPSYLQWFTQENNLHHLQSQTQSQSQEDDDDEIFFRLHAPNPNYQNLPGYAATNSVNTNNPVTIVRPRDEVSAQIFGSNSNWDIGTLLQNSMVSEYDMGGEGDLFKAPEPIIEEPELDLDPMTAAISMISSGNDLTAAEAIKVAEIESIRNEHLLDEVFYECKKDLLAKSAIEEQFLELSDVKIPALQIEDDPTEPKNKSVTDGAIQKSVSSGCLKSMEWISGGASMRPNFLEFQGMDLGTALGLRRAYSEGDIQALGYGNTSLPNTSTVHPPIERLISIGNQKIEERRQKLSRYRKKKSKRNFGRKIKYACRKALADSQPRVRGRFAKTEESDVAKPF